MSKKLLIILFILLFCTGIFIVAQRTAVQSSGILILVGDGVGYNYFDILETLQGLGFEPVTIAQSSRIKSCYNREERIVPIDLYLDDFNPKDLSDYGVLVIPSGGHYKYLSHSKDTKNLISYAHEEGLIIAAIGTGMSVLSSVPGLLQDVRVAENTFFRDDLILAKAEMGYAKVEYDKSILTGSNGGGKNGSGYKGAPVSAFCEKLSELIK